MNSRNLRMRLKCEVCGSDTAQGRTRCLSHRPYGEKLLADLKADESINAAIRAGKRPDVDFSGPTGSEILSYIGTVGSRKYLLQYFPDEVVLDYYLNKFREAGLIEFVEEYNRGKFLTMYVRQYDLREETELG